MNSSMLCTLMYLVSDVLKQSPHVLLVAHCQLSVLPALSIQ